MTRHLGVLTMVVALGGLGAGAELSSRLVAAQAPAPAPPPAPGAAAAGDWPQWRGPNRDGISRETGLLKTWPRTGPPVAWTASDLGAGFGSVSVRGDRVFV